VNGLETTDKKNILEPKEIMNTRINITIGFIKTRTLLRIILRINLKETKK